MSYEYRLEHDGTAAVDLNRLRRVLGTNELVNDDFSIAIESPKAIYFASNRTDAGRRAFAIVIEHLSSISHAVIVEEL